MIGRTWARSPRVILLALALLVTVGVMPGGAQDPWTPLGPSSPDQDSRMPRPDTFQDIEGPVVVEPVGPIPVATTDRTNLVLLVIDDLAELDERVWSRLPTIRSLFLDQGVRFTNAFVNDPLCCPGRAALLTGLTTDHHGVFENDFALFDPRVTLATELREAGYYTFMAGKYLNGGIDSPAVPPGWDRAAFTGNGYYDYHEAVDGTWLFRDDDENDYQPDVAANRALEFLRAAPPDRPVFAYLTPFSVHAGRDPRIPDHPRSRPAVADRFRGAPECAGIEPWTTPANADDLADRPLHQQGWTANGPFKLVDVCESLMAVDAGLARVVAELDAQGRLADTLFVLTADNGMGNGAHGYREKAVSFATPVPLYISWAAGRGTARADEAAYVSTIDLAPTLCAIGGCVMGPFPDGPEGADGVDLVPLITGAATLSQRVIYTEHLTDPLWRAVRTPPDHPLGMWTYTRYSTGERELYDVSGGPCVSWVVGGAGDPCELTNRAGDPALAEVEAALSQLLDEAVASGGAAPPFRGTLVAPPG